MKKASDSEKPANKFVQMLRPSRTIPITPWRAESTWSIGHGSHHIQRFFILVFGLFIFGIGDSLLIITGLGNAPWSVLAQGISLNTPFSIGEATFFISLTVLALWIPLKQMPGLGTVANIIVIAVAIEIGLAFIPKVDNLAFKYFYIVFGIALVGIGSAFYITCGLGTGPRDGLMTGLHYRTGIRVGRSGPSHVTHLIWIPGRVPNSKHNLFGAVSWITFTDSALTAENPPPPEPFRWSKLGDTAGTYSQ